jgi:hypothetical protein
MQPIEVGIEGRSRARPIEKRTGRLEEKKLDRNQARVARAGERKSLCSDTMLGISNLYSQEAKGQYIYMYMCGEYAGNPSYKWENTQYII